MLEDIIWKRSLKCTYDMNADLKDDLLFRRLQGRTEETQLKKNKNSC